MTKFHIKDITAEFYNEEIFTNNIKIAFDARVSLYTAEQKSPQEFEKQLNMIMKGVREQKLAKYYNRKYY